MAGETTSVAALARVTPKKLPFPALTATVFTLTYATTQLEANDVMEAGFVPANVTVVGFLYAPGDLDTNGSPAVVQKITIGSTDVATGLTGAQSGARSFVAINPYSVGDAPELVKVTTTTAPGTAAAGTVYLTPIYASN